MARVLSCPKPPGVPADAFRMLTRCWLPEWMVQMSSKTLWPASSITINRLGVGSAA